MFISLNVQSVLAIIGMQTGVITGSQAGCLLNTGRNLIDMRKVLVLFTVVFALATVSFGQQQDEPKEFSPKGEVFVGYSYVHSDLRNLSLDSRGMNGASLQATGFLHNTLGVTADVTLVKASNVQDESGVNVVRYLYLFGPTYEVRNGSPVTPFVHVLFGEDHERLSISQFGDTSTNSFATAFGGGFDAHVTDHLAVRLGQFDYIRTSHTDGENHFRYSGGVVIKF